MDEEDQPDQTAPRRAWAEVHTKKVWWLGLLDLALTAMIYTLLMYHIVLAIWPEQTNADKSPPIVAAVTTVSVAISTLLVYLCLLSVVCKKQRNEARQERDRARQQRDDARTDVTERATDRDGALVRIRELRQELFRERGIIGRQSALDALVRRLRATPLHPPSGIGGIADASIVEITQVIGGRLTADVTARELEDAFFRKDLAIGGGSAFAAGREYIRVLDAEGMLDVRTESFTRLNDGTPVMGTPEQHYTWNVRGREFYERVMNDEKVTRHNG